MTIDCGCNPTGVLQQQTYGATAPPDGAILVQRCDACETYEGDLDAAVAFARDRGGRVHAIVCSVDAASAVLAEHSDVWVMPGEPAGPVVLHSIPEAVAAGWIVTPES